MSNYTKENLIQIPPSAVPAGTLAIKIGDEIFTPGNIRISSGGATEYYKCTSVDTVNKTWTGYKAVLTDGAYSFEESETTGLTYGLGYTPVVNKIYTGDALVQIQKLYNKMIIPTEGQVFFDELSNLDRWDNSGLAIVQDDNRDVIEMNNNGQRKYAKITTDPGVPLGKSPRTMSFWFKQFEAIHNGFVAVGYGKGNSYYAYFDWGLMDGYPVMTAYGYDNFQTSSGLITDSNWHHSLVTFNGRYVYQYLDGQQIWTWDAPDINTQWDCIFLGDPWNTYYPNARFADFYIYNRVLSSDEIQQLFNAKTV